MKNQKWKLYFLTQLLEEAFMQPEDSLRFTRFRINVKFRSLINLDEILII